MTVKPHIDGEKVKKIEISGSIIPAREEGFPLTELSAVIKALNYLDGILDFSLVGVAGDKVEEWTSEEIEEFLEERNAKQRAFFRLLIENDEIERDDVIKAISKIDAKFDGRALAGALGGIGVRTNTLGKVRLYSKKWKIVDNEWHCYYKINSEYLDFISKWFEKEEG